MLPAPSVRPFSATGRSIGHRIAKELKTSLRGALALSLLIHVALLWSGRDAFEPQPGPPPSANPNLQIVVRAPGPRPGLESAPRMPAPKLAQRVPPTDPSKPVEGAGQHASPQVVPATDFVAERAASLAPSPRSEGAQSVAAVADPARPVAADRTPTGPATGLTVATRAAVGQASQAADPEDVMSYRMRLANLAGRFKEYPPLARERGLEGVVRVRVRLAPGLVHPEVSLGTSSGVALLDDAAVAMIARASRTVDLPLRLRGRAADIDLPVDYRLD
jgi:periplasmic protein TonB